MKVHRSNRVEALLQTLLALLETPSTGPFCPEPVVVHSRAMALWLSQRLAEHFGGWAQPHFPFPRRFIEDAMAAVLGPEVVERAQAWSRPRLCWAVLAELPRKLGDPLYEPLARYLADDPRPHAAFGLAEQVADVFDQYMVFRPQMVLSWQHRIGSESGAAAWQADLWRALAGRLGPTNLATLSVDLSNALVDRGAREHLRAAFGDRVCVFGVASLPPLLLQLLDRLSRHLDVHLLLTSPSREYWADIRSDRQALRAARRRDAGEGPATTAEALTADANAMLASFGAVGRDFQRVLESEVDYTEDADDLYVEPTATHALATLQADMLHMRRRGTPQCPAAPLSPDDDSIAVHACHSPMREVEVLHDQLLALLARPNAPAPHDVVVLMTDVDTYAPLVEAVFERDRGDPRWIPYCIADRTARADSPVVEAFHRITEMVGGRVTASEVLDVLALSPVQRRFELSADDVDRIAQWVSESGIRWGIDGRHRAEHGQPRYEENTWRFGLQRLLLGLAMRGHDRETFAGVLPYDEVEGSEAAIVGKLARFCDELFARLAALAAAHTPAAWRIELSAVLDGLLDESQDAAFDHQRLRDAVDAAAADAEAAGFTHAVDGQTMRRTVQARLADAQGSRGLMTGGVTFCAMLPLRSLPFSTVCLLGMSDGAFPRASTRIGFDLMAHKPRAGDRHRRAEDRYLFMEAVMMARDRLLVTYVGQSIVDNAVRPPSVALAELLDVAAESFVVDGGEAALRDRLVVRHPMQPFSPRYFGADPDPRLFSYAEAYLQGAVAVSAGRRALETIPLLDQPLPAPTGPREVGLPQLIRFFQRPPEELLKRRLGLYLKDEPREHADREPIELDALESWRAGDAILGHNLDGIDPERSQELLRAAGQLPLGTPGAVRWDELRSAADPIAAIARALRRGARRPAQPVDLSIDGTRILGRLPPRYPSGLVLHQYSRVWPKKKIATWISHLVLGCVAAPEDGQITCIVGRAERGDNSQLCQFAPVADPRAQLAALLRLYWIGQQEPLLLFPRSAWAYAEARKAGKSDRDALAKARAVFTGRFAEGEDPYVQRLFGGADPLQPGFSLFATPMAGGDFVGVTDAILTPLRQHMTVD